MMSIRVIPFIAVFLLARTILAAGQLSQSEWRSATELGRKCLAPIVKVTSPGGDFDVYVESPVARAALVTAMLTIAGHPVDGMPGLDRSLQPGYRVWFVRKPTARQTASIERVELRKRASILRASSIRDERLFVARAPSHGIIEPLRARFPEYVFESAPAAGYDVVARTDAGEQRYHVTEQDREAVMNVCNPPR
jgi:hypothetical protein